MRISTQMMYDQNMRGITDSQSKWLSYGEQMSTGKRVNRPSDDPIAFFTSALTNIDNCIKKRAGSL